MRVSAKSDYALRALIEMAGRADGKAVSAEELGKLQDIPHGFLQAILADLRRAGLVMSQRGQSGGWRMGRDAADITVADVIRAVDGPLVSVYGLRPEAVRYNDDRRGAPARLDRRPPLAARRLRGGLDPAARRRQAAQGRHLAHVRRGRLAAPLTSPAVRSRAEAKPSHVCRLPAQHQPTFGACRRSVPSRPVPPLIQIAGVRASRRAPALACGTRWS